MRRLGLLLALHCVGCDTPKRSDAPGGTLADAGYAVAVSPGGRFTAAWRPIGGAVPVNELFQIEVLLFEGRCTGDGTSRPLCGATVQASAWMPEHMHGMNRRPNAIETEPGRYLVSGMMLHMEGFWQLFLDVTAAQGSERVEFAITLR